MSSVTDLFKESSYYFLGRLSIMLAGLISFPILTRVLSVSEYGILGLATSTLMMVVPLGKLGMQHSAIRFYGEFKEGKRNGSLSHFYSTFFLTSLGASANVTVLFNLVIYTDLLSGFFDTNVRKALAFASILLFFRGIQGTLMAFLRVRRATKVYNIVDTFQRYATVLLGVYFLFHVIHGLYGFLTAMIIVEGMVCFYLSYKHLRMHKTSWANFSPSFLSDCLTYALPMAAVEIFSLTLAHADKYLLQYYLGTTELGIYTAGLNFVRYFTEAFNASLLLAILPIYLQIWQSKGERETREFLSRSFKYVLLMIIPASFAFLAIAKDVIVFLASQKYSAASMIVPYILPGKMLLAICPILHAGIYIHRRTSMLAVFLILSCILNILLDLLLISRYGIVGAAIGTLTAYSFFIVSSSIYSFRRFNFEIHYYNIVLYTLCGAAMFASIRGFQCGNQIETMVLRMGLGFMLYAFLILLFDRDIRSIFSVFLNQFLFAFVRNLVHRNEQQSKL